MINRQFYLGGEITDSYKDGQVDLPRIRKGSLKTIFFSLFSSEEYYPRRLRVKHTMQLMDLALRQIEKHRDQIEIALHASDIERINKAQGKSRPSSIWKVALIWTAIWVSCATSIGSVCAQPCCRHQFHQQLRRFLLRAAKWNSVNDREPRCDSRDEPAGHGDQRGARLE
jgi:hypothetical protein